MYHHDDRDYETAASEAAKFARTKFEKMIADGRASAGALLEKVNREVPQDRIVRGDKLAFEWDDNGLLVAFPDTRTAGEQRIHSHALGQLATRADIPTEYLRELAGAKGKDGKPVAWKRELAAHTLRQSYGNLGGRYLARSVDTGNGYELRGVVSDKYRRYDVVPLVEHFVKAIKLVDAVPLGGVSSDVRVSLRAVLPLIFEPVPNEVMLVGMELKNSDFGAGGFSLSLFIDRIWCTNLATMSDEFSKVHIGGRLPDSIELSQKTYELDTQTMTSAVKDVVMASLGAKKVNALMAGIKSANEKEIDWKSAKTRLTKQLLKGELKEVEDAFESKDDVMLPPGKSQWRLSNALSWIAQKSSDADRRMELERLAGKVLEEGKAA